MKKDMIVSGSKSCLVLAAVVALLLAGSANFALAQRRPLPPDQIDAARTWNNTGTDFNAPGSWTGGAPGSNDVGLFATAPTGSPTLTAPITIAGLRFSAGSSGYTIGNTGSFVLTLNGENTTGSGGTTTLSASAIRNDNTSGTITINDTPINLAPSTGISTIFQDAGDGSTLILNVPIFQTGTVALSLKNGTIQLNNANVYSGGTSIDAAGTTVVLGNDSGLGTGTFTVNNTSNIQSGGAPRIIANATTLDGTLTVGGAANFTFNGAVTLGPSAVTRTLTVNNSATTTLAGSVFLSGVAGTGRTLTINGTGNATISGVISNFNGAGTAGSLVKSGAGTLTLTNTNTYTGTTTVAGGTLIANADGALGTGNVSLTASGVTLTLQGGATNNYISDSASLSLVTGSTVNLNFTVTPDTVNMLVYNGVAQAAGLWGSATSGAPNVLAEFMGTGEILVLIPEPSTWAMTIVGAGLLLGAQRFRRKKS